MQHISVNLINIIRGIILVFLILFFMLPGQVLSDEITIIEEQKAWTALYYIATDTSNPWWNIFVNLDILEAKLIKELASADNLHVLVLQDRRRSPAVLYYIDEDHQKIVLDELGEVNTGDPQTLKDFIAFGKEQYPADRYQLVFFGHANAWYGLCPDDTNGGDALTIVECQQALRDVDGVDLICFLGCCQMGNVESVYELRDVCDVYVGSESSGNENDWHGMIDDLCRLLNDETSMSTIEIGYRIVELICNNPNEFYDTLTISAIRTDFIVDLIDCFDALCLKLYESDTPLYQNLLAARNQTKDYYFIKGSVLLDFTDFINHYIAIETDETILRLLENIQINLSRSIIAECHGPAEHNSHGLSVFYSSKDMLSIYADYGLDFTQDTHWDELLIKHMKKGKSLLSEGFLPFQPLTNIFDRYFMFVRIN